MGGTVYHKATRTTDALTAVVFKRDGFLALPDQLFVDHVEHFQERHVLADVAGIVTYHAARGCGICLPPNMQGQVHL